MKQLRYWSFLPAACLLALPLFGQSSLQLGGAPVAKEGDVTNVTVTLDADGEVEGIVVAADWNGGVGLGDSLTPGAVVAGADVLVTRLEPDYAVLGAVMDNDGVDPTVIPAGESLIATIGIEILAADEVLSVQLTDSTYASMEGSPLLDNIIVQGGLSIGSEEGLGGVGPDGKFDVPTVDCLPRLFFSGPLANNNEPTAVANVMLENCVPVEGYVVAVCHGPGVVPIDIVPGSAAVAAPFEFAAGELSATGATLGVVLDFEAPFAGQTLDPGVNQVAVITYSVEDDSVSSVPLEFCDNVLGDPLKENVYVTGGRSIGRGEGLVLFDDALTITPIGDRREICDNGIDDDGNGLIDSEDPACQQGFYCGNRELGDDGLPTDVEIPLGGEAEVCFFLLTPEDNAIGEIQQFDHVQGFSMSVSYSCSLSAEEDLDISGTILEALGAEFVSVQADNDPNDGDGCELIIGVLVDALPPFDGATIPPSDLLQRVGCVTFHASDSPDVCGEEGVFEFVDGLKGRGNVPVKNLISVENQSRRPALNNCGYTVVGARIFFRGDCNFSGEGMGMAVNIADAATTISALFAPDVLKPEIQCEDACDCNDDGRFDLADAMCILNYLFKFGRVPSAPGPGLDPVTWEPTPPGPDPTPDALTCEMGTGCR